MIKNINFKYYSNVKKIPPKEKTDYQHAKLYHSQYGKNCQFTKSVLHKNSTKLRLHHSLKKKS